jgi:hypothetical protein
MPVWISDAVAPRLLLLASAPWHELQYEAYSDAPSVEVGVGVGVGAGVDPNAVAMAWICAVVRLDRDLMPLTLLMPVWISDTVAPRWPLLANRPWHELQYVVYSDAPSVVVGVGVGDGAGDGVDPNAAAIACICALVRFESCPMERTPVTAVWIRATVAPRLLLVARAPWQESQ